MSPDTTKGWISIKVGPAELLRTCDIDIAGCVLLGIPDQEGPVNVVGVALNPAANFIVV